MPARHINENGYLKVSNRRRWLSNPPVSTVFDSEGVVGTGRPRPRRRPAEAVSSPAGGVGRAVAAERYALGLGRGRPCHGGPPPRARLTPVEAHGCGGAGCARGRRAPAMAPKPAAARAPGVPPWSQPMRGTRLNLLALACSGSCTGPSEADAARDSRRALPHASSRGAGDGGARARRPRHRGRPRGGPGGDVVTGGAPAQGLSCACAGGALQHAPKPPGLMPSGGGCVRSGTLNRRLASFTSQGLATPRGHHLGGVRLLEPERSRRCSRTGEKDMSVERLEATARALVSPGKGILAADESHPSIARRFEPLGIPNSEDTRRRYRQMLLTTPGAADYVSGVILFDETIRQKADDGTPLVEVLSRQGIIPGHQGRSRREGPRRRPGRAGDRRPRRAPGAARRVLGPRAPASPSGAR